MVLKFGTTNILRFMQMCKNAPCNKWHTSYTHQRLIMLLIPQLKV